MSATNSHTFGTAKLRQNSSRARTRNGSRIRTDSGSESPAPLESPHPSPRTRLPSKADARKRSSRLLHSISDREAGILTLQTPSGRDDTTIFETAAEDTKGENTAEARKESAGKDATTSKRSSASGACRSFKDQVRERCRSIGPFLTVGEWPVSEKQKRSAEEGPAERLISQSGIMKRRSRSAKSPEPIVPLRLPPPHARTTSGIGRERTVNLETPFATPMPRAYTAAPLLYKTRTHYSKEGASPIWKRIQRIPGVSGILGSRSSGNGRSKAHRSLEHENLHRVTSILDDLAESPRTENDARVEVLPESLLDALSKTAKRSATFSLPGAIRTRHRAKSDASVDSSLHPPRVHVPLNTPELRETYKIKRSPSADTEEFMKIDISVRGETSYLPSEARRIQTPPLPGQGPDEKRTPFFFDYSMPSGDLHANSCPSRTKLPVSTTSSLFTPESRFADSIDWIDMELAHVDAIGDSSNTTRLFKGDGRDRYTEPVDLRIPEHLPTSPLCPRHPRHRSGGTGSCWMHGMN